MKTFLKHTFFLSFLILMLNQVVDAQENTIDKQLKKSTITTLAQQLEDHYVFPELGKETGEYLKKQLKAGRFDACKDLKSFAKELTKEAQLKTKDKHMRILARAPRVRKKPTIEEMVKAQIRDKEWERENGNAFFAVQRFQGNIGYLDIRAFSPAFIGSKEADLYMNLLASSDAIIIDLSKNGGGDPSMVQYLCSFFFNKRIHLNSLYYRKGNKTEEFWTLDKVGGEKMPDVPLFIVTSDYTFSGAEEFSYNMKTQKRATIVGDTTGGGANPGGQLRINEQFVVFMPGGKAINPITKTNWEGVGVLPDVLVTDGTALEKTKELAGKAAKEFRNKRIGQQEIFLNELHNLLKEPAKASKEKILAHLQKGCKSNMLTEGDINRTGYAYFQALKNPEAAKLLFYANTQIFPKSANTYDSYAELLLKTGEKDMAVENYKKAVAVGKENKDPQLKLFEENLERAMKK